MRKPGGYNPMNWECEKNGCFNVKMRPKIEKFSEAFRGNLSFGDFDAVIEREYCFLSIEWKSRDGKLPMGQHATFHALTKTSDWIVFVLIGNAETMKITKMDCFIRGVRQGAVDSDFETILSIFKEWDDAVFRNDDMAKRKLFLGLSKKTETVRSLRTLTTKQFLAAGLLDKMSEEELKFTASRASKLLSELERSRKRTAHSKALS